MEAGQPNKPSADLTILYQAACVATAQNQPVSLDVITSARYSLLKEGVFIPYTEWLRRFTGVEEKIPVNLPKVPGGADSQLDALAQKDKEAKGLKDGN